MVSYLVFFLTGLSYGLAWANRTAIDSWNSDGIVLATAGNKSLVSSSFDRSLSKDIDAEEKAELVAINAVVLKNGMDDDASKIDTIFFGIDQSSFILPEPTEGRSIQTSDEVIVDKSIQNKYSVSLGDKLKTVTNNKDYTIVGFTENSQFNTQPIVFTSIENVQGMKFGMSNQESAEQINAVVVRGINDQSSLPEGLEYIDNNTFIQNIPGYQAQVLTFGLMIGMLVLISAIVIGIFMYILTIQKQKVFGIMKAQGISARVIGSSVLLQTILLSFTGVFAGLVLTFLTSLALPSGVPYLNNWNYFGIISVIMITTSAIGSLLSVRVVTKIDPLEAIG